MHQNVLHLLGNMVFLAAVGPAVEMAAGSVRFVLVYFLGGFAGVIAHWLFTQNTHHVPPLIGASGCVSACIAYYAYRYYHMKVSLAPRWSVPITWIIAIWVALQISGAFISIGAAAGGTAYWAHLGGFAMGIILGLTFGAPQEAQVQLARDAVTKMEKRSPAAKLAAAENVLRAVPNDPEALWQKAQALEQLNDSQEEAACLLKYLDAAPESEQADALIRLDKMKRLDILPSRRRMIMADRYRPTLPDLSRLLLLSIVDSRDDGARPDALYELACLDQTDYPSSAESWIKKLYDDYPLHAASDLARAKGWSQ